MKRGITKSKSIIYIYIYMFGVDSIKKVVGSGPNSQAWEYITAIRFHPIPHTCHIGMALYSSNHMVKMCVLSVGGIFSIDSSTMMANYPQVLNLNRLFLKLNRFIDKHGPLTAHLNSRLKATLPHEPRAVTMKLWEPKRRVSKCHPNTPPTSCCSMDTGSQV